MAVDCVSPCLAIRSSVAIELWASSGSKQPYEHKSNLPREETKNSRSISFSPDGRYFAYSNGKEVKVLKTNNWKLQCKLPRPKAFYLKFSPRGNYLCTWELYVITKDIPEGSPNMFVYEIATGKQVFSIVQKKQTDWEPAWSSDESIFAIVVGGESLFYDLSQGIEGFKSTTKKIGGSRGGILSVGPGSSPPFIAIYTPGAKGAPSMCKLYKYPALGQNQTLACKSFFNADRVEMMWNKRGTGLLLLTSTEVDKTGASYYGNQALHFLNTKGDSCSVPLSKDGPVHCVKWSPKSTEFVVVYGYMPSKAALYNLKCDVIFDFKEGPRNCAYFNPFGNLVVLAGFGNLPGNVEIWDVNTKEMIANIKCPDTTHFEWNPNGEHFVTATTAPRLRIGNGFKVYHYSGALMHETIWPQGQELLAVEWQQFAENTLAEPTITKAKQEGIKSSQPQASAMAYTPPHLRGNKKQTIEPKSTIPGLPPGYTPSRANNKKQGAQKSQQQQQQQNNQQQNQQQQNKQNPSKKRQQRNFERARARRESRGEGGGNANEHSSPNTNENNDKHASNNGGDGVLADQTSVTNTGDQEENNQQQGGNQNKRNPNNRRQQPHQQQYQKKQQQHQNPNQLVHGSNPDDGEIILENNSQEGQKQLHKSINQQQHGGEVQQSQQPTKKAANSEKDKKIRNVAKKLSDIKKLKVRQEQGEVLELNQLNKISMEAKFLEELKALKLSN